MSFAAIEQATSDAAFAAFGVDATWTPADTGAPVALRAVLAERTHITSELGDIIDPRPHLELPIAIVGHRPQGTVALLGRTFDLDKPVDGEDDARVIRVYVREVQA